VPFVVAKDTDACLVAKPWGVFTRTPGYPDKLHGCHASEASAKSQQAAMYANVPDAKGTPMTGQLEIREAADGASWEMMGLATTWSPPGPRYSVTDTRNGTYDEGIERGAFGGAADGRDKCVCWWSTPRTSRRSRRPAAVGR
jgi:hypothetical protein